MNYKKLKNLVKDSISNINSDNILIPTYQYYNKDELEKINNKINTHKIYFVHTDNASFPNHIRIVKK